MIRFACKSCRKDFQLTGVCPQCGRRAEKNKNDVYILDDQNFFYGIPSRDTICNSLEKYKGGISPLVRLDYYDHVQQGQRHIGKYLGDPRRVAPIACLEREALKGATVLDYGCGLGVFSMNLAEHCHEVCAVDATLERAEFTQVICSHLHDKSIIAVKGSIDSPLFFADRQFDLIILNGVLEWTPVTVDTTLPPREVLINFLVRIKRLLKPAGVIYVGIENRFALNYFLGQPDHHSNLLFGSLLPRWIAHIYSKSTKGMPYRTYTYSNHGYRRLFNDAGLNVLLDYSLYPSYQFPQYLCATERYSEFFRKQVCGGKPSGRRMKFLKFLSQIPFSDVILKKTQPAFGFFVSESSSSNIVAKSKKSYYLSQDGYLQSRTKDRREYQKLSTKVWKVDDAPFDVQRRIRFSLKQAGRHDLAVLIPAIAPRGHVWEEDILPGSLLVENMNEFRLRKPDEAFWRLYRIAVQLMAEIYEVVREQKEVSFARFAKEWFEKQRKLYCFDQTASIMDELASILSSIPERATVHLSPIHGNMSPKNILCEEKRVTGFIDWAMAESQGCCEIDLLDSFYCYLRFILGVTPHFDELFFKLREIHELFTDTPLLPSPSESVDELYFFTAIHNTIVRGRGCYLPIDELKLIIRSWRKYRITESNRKS